MLPALLMGLSALAVGALAVLPAPSVRPDALVVRTAVAAPHQLGVPAADELRLLPDVPAPKPVVTRPVPRPVKRVSRSRPAVIADVGGGGYFCPVAGERHFSDDFGAPRPGGRRHQGNDVLAAYGTPVVAVTAGTIHTDYSSRGGISLYLRGVDGNEYFYAHNSRNVATDGERVRAGQLVAYVGNTGDARGGPTHVHFELHPGGGSPVDPYAFLVRACR